jgi:hypothetical protein
VARNDLDSLPSLERMAVGFSDSEQALTVIELSRD